MLPSNSYEILLCKCCTLLKAVLQLCSSHSQSWSCCSRDIGCLVLTCFSIGSLGFESWARRFMLCCPSGFYSIEHIGCLQNVILLPCTELQYAYFFLYSKRSAVPCLFMLLHCFWYFQWIWCFYGFIWCWIPIMWALCLVVVIMLFLNFKGNSAKSHG